MLSVHAACHAHVAVFEMEFKKLDAKLNRNKNEEKLKAFWLFSF
jgi:hypothetical protein